MRNVKRSWIEISIDQIIKNYTLYKSFSVTRSIMAVVKADAYGHGAERVAKALQDYGVSDFAVSNIIEAIELRDAGITGQILILGYTPVEEAENLVKYDITQALLSEEYSTDLIRTGIPVKCHYAIDTGMNRIGLDADNIASCEKSIRSAAQHLNLTVYLRTCV